MGKKNREKMTRLTVQGRIERAETRRREEEERKHQLWLELAKKILGG
ncbi:hypothetical protein ES702_00469 [subsurface metagenome]